MTRRLRTLWLVAALLAVVAGVLGGSTTPARADDALPPVSVDVAEGITASDSDVPLPGAQVPAAEQIALNDAIAILLGLSLPATELISANDAVSIQLGPPPDTTPPAVTPTITGTLGQNGWYTSDVHVTWGVSEPDSPSTLTTSGCDAVDVTSDTTGETFTCTATSAGGTASQSVTIMRDATPPVATVALDRGPDFGSWYNAPVGWSTTGTDATSGIASCTTGTYSGPDSATASVPGTCTDEAGNTSAPVRVGFEYDSTPPNVTVALARDPDHGGWYNRPLDWTVNGSDGVSGATCSAGGTYSGPDSFTASVPGSCTNGAGLSTASSTSFQYDATAPTDVVTTLDRGPDFGSWYNAPVGWTTTGTDDTSGIASCTSGTYSGPDSATASVPGTCTDEAGNTSAPVRVGFEYDSTPPTVTVALARGPDHGGWYNHAVDWSVSGGDGVSGATCSAGGTYAGPDSFSASVPGTCTSGAGLSAAATKSFQYDATPPANVVTTLARVPDSNGWYNHGVGWTTTGSDATSGIASCTGGTYSGPDLASASVAGSCTDAAGNTTNASSVPFEYDTTPPPIALTAPADGSSYVLHQNVAAAYSCGPDLSGVASCSGTVASGSPLDTSTVGTHTFSVSTTDVAANSASKSASYAVQYAPAGQSCDGAPGRAVLDPVAADGSSVFKAGRTVPIKFRVCDANGVSIGSPGVVTSFKLVQTISGTAVDTVNEDPASTTPDTSFRWDATGQQWIFNLSTSALAAGQTYAYSIGLNDGTSITFRFGLR